MRRKISDKALNDAADGLPDLTEQQRKFVEGVLMGKTLIDSYRAAYDCSNMLPNSIWCEASIKRSRRNGGFATSTRRNCAPISSG